MEFWRDYKSETAAQLWPKSSRVEKRFVLNKKQKGICFILLAAFSFSVMNTLVKLSGDLPFIQKSFFRNFVAFLAAGAVLLRSEEKFQFQRKNLFPLTLRAILGTIGILGNFYAVDHMLLSDATMLNKLSPFFNIIFSFFLLKEHIRPFQAVAIVTAFVGSLFIIKPGFQLESNLIPSLVGILGAVGAGSAYSLVRYLRGRGERGPFIVFYFSAFSSLVALPFLLFDFHPMTGWQILLLFGAGLFAASGQFAITAAYSCAPAKEISIFDYTQVIFSAILGYFIFQQIPDQYSFVGYFIICGASVWMYFYHKK